MGGSGTETASEDVDPVAVPVFVLAARVTVASAAGVCALGGEVLGDPVVVRVESGGRSRQAVVKGGGQLVEAVLVVRVGR